VTAPKQARSSGGKRFYSWRNERYWSVTTIIGGGLPKPVLVNWAKKFTAEYAVNHFDAFSTLVGDDPAGAIEWLKGAAFRDRDKKADLGSAVHAASEAFKLGKPMPDWSPLVKPHMLQYVAFLEEYRPKILAAEASVYNRSQSYAGTLDAIASFGKRKLIYDIKTGKGVYPEVGLQLAAYRYAEFIGLPDGSEREMPKVDGCAVLHLTDQGYDFREVQADEDIFRSFLYVREVFRFQDSVAKHVLGPTIKAPRKRKVSEPEPQVMAASPTGESVLDAASTGSEQTTLLPDGPRTREQEEVLGVDIFGEEVPA
jgi:hypothetical protein